jgi:hypothetical protein
MSISYARGETRGWFDDKNLIFMEKLGRGARVEGQG